jgi:predicted dinucleotide-binding enzyme
MKVAIIGAGNVGKALGGSLARAGHEVKLAANHQESARAAAAEIRATAAASPVEAATGAEVIILAVPYGAIKEVAADIGPVAADRVVVDVTNPVAPDLSGLLPQTSAAEELQAALPAARVVKAFNTLLASRQAQPWLNGQPADGFVAGDDSAAKETVLGLAESIGLRPVDAGPLAWARYLEGMALLNMGINVFQGGNWTSAWRLEA